MPAAAVDAGARRSLAAYGGGLLLSLVLAVLAALLVARGIARPIADLSEAAQALGRRRPLRLPEAGIVEIRAVAAALAAAAVEREAHEVERESPAAARAGGARRGGAREPRQGRVPRHARPRAAQPARRAVERQLELQARNAARTPRSARRK